MANNNFAYIEKTMPKVIDTVFAQESLTEMLIGENYTNLNFIDAKTVNVTKLATTGLTPYQRGGHGQANKTGAAQSTHEQFTLKQERFSAIPLDKLDALDDSETVLGSLAGEFLRVHCIPEFDAYRFSKLAGYTNTFLGNRKEGVIAPNTIIKEFNEAFKVMREAKVPTANQILYVSPTVMEMIRNTDELVKHLTQAEYNGDVKFTIEKYEGRPIVEVPSDEFFTDIVIGEGYYPSATSKAINFMVVDKKAPIIIKKLDWAKVYSSDEVKLGFVGYEFDNLYYHDIFVPDNKQMAIYCHVSSAAAASSKLLAKLVKGSAGGNTQVETVLTQPAGIIWDKLVNITDGGSHKVGDSDTGTQIYLNKDFAPNGSHNVIAAIFDGKIVALSEDFTTKMPKK